MRQLHGVIFDIDGTLVDTTYLHVVTWWEALCQHGHPVPMSKISSGIGMSADQLLPYLLGDDLRTREYEQVIAAHATLYQPYWGRLQPLPGARHLVRACRDRDMRVVLASLAPQDELDALLRALNVADSVDLATSAGNGSAGRPAPNAIEVALDRSGLDADRVVFVGDSVWDVSASAKLGVPCIGLTCGGTEERALREAGAAAVFETPSHLQYEWDEAQAALPGAGY